MIVVQNILPRPFEWVLFRADSLPGADLRDLEVEIVGPGQPLRREHESFLRRHISALSLWWLLRWHHRGEGWVFFAASGGCLCHYTFVTPARRYGRIFPVMEAGAQLIGPCFTEEAFRGRAIYPRMLCHTVGVLGGRGLRPFYIHTSLGNTASVRGIEKAGFVRCGVWRGKRYLFDYWVSSRRVTD